MCPTPPSYVCSGAHTHSSCVGHCLRPAHARFWARLWPFEGGRNGGRGGGCGGGRRRSQYNGDDALCSDAATNCESNPSVSMETSALQPRESVVQAAYSGIAARMYADCSILGGPCGAARGKFRRSAYSISGRQRSHQIQEPKKSTILHNLRTVVVDPRSSRWRSMP